MKRKILITLLAVTLLLALALPIQMGSAAGPIVNVPTAVNGRILTTDKTGDISDWVEIAQNGGYSLIIRKSYINIYPNGHYGEQSWQYTPYGTSNAYASSSVRNRINAWFNNTATGAADNLPSGAKLRDYTVLNNALNTLGTCNSDAAMTNGYSKPTDTKVRTGNDVAFPLSYGEAANFCSMSHDMRNKNPQIQPSSAMAIANYNKLSIPQGYLYGIWLRSPGDNNTTAGAMTNSGGYNSTSFGRVFQFQINPVNYNEYGLVYPALWVDSTIFGAVADKGTIVVTHKDRETNEILRQDTFTVDPGPYGPYNPITLTGYSAGSLAPGSDPASGTIAAGQTRNITYLYTGDTTCGPITDVPTAVDGRTLTTDKTGDSSDWIEIARNGCYSLIVRKNYINIYPSGHSNEPSWQHTAYGSTNAYASSTVRNRINAWFGSVASGTADNLPSGARLRDYTVQNNSLYVLGTSNYDASMTNGYSKPTDIKIRNGSDVAFPLSYGEAANFCSISHDIRTRNPQIQPSSATAAASYNKLSMPSGYLYGMWLRSPGDSSNTAGSLTNNGGYYGASNGRVFQFQLSSAGYSEYGLVYPALWVDSSIFYTTGTVVVTHKDSVTGEILRQNTYDVNPGTYGPYNPESFPGYGAGTLAPGSDPASGTIAAGQTRNVTYLYGKMATIIVIHQGSINGNEIWRDVIEVEPGPYGPYNNYPFFPDYDAGAWDPTSAPRSGTIEAGQTLTIRFLYGPLV